MKTLILLTLSLIGLSACAETKETQIRSIGILKNVKPTSMPQSEAAPKTRAASQPAAALPSGPSSPEGVACDLALAFIKNDYALFKSTCIKPLGKGSGATQYREFLDHMHQQFAHVATLESIPQQAPAKINKVFKARLLSLSGPSSYAYSFFNFHALRFVDVLTENGLGEQFNCRTLVLMDSSNNWHVLPYPPAYPLLSDGLNEESASTDLIYSRKD